MSKASTLRWYYVGKDIFVPWEEIEALLGHPHTGNADEDAEILDALVASGAPAWVKDPGIDGYLDENGWAIRNPF